MKKTGIFLIILGVGSFLLPAMGLQFRILMLFGEAAPVIGIIVFVIGVILIIVGTVSEKKEVQNMVKNSSSTNIPNTGSKTGRKCYACKADISGTDTVCPKCKTPL